MDAKNPIQHIARPIQVFMVTLVVLLVIVILEAIAFEVTSLLGPAPALGSREPRKELTAEQEETQRILHAQKEFLPDGTLHLVTEIGARQRQSLDEASPGTPMGRERVYDTNDKLLWEGPAEQCPYHYLLWAWDFGGQRFALPDENDTGRLTRYLADPRVPRSNGRHAPGDVGLRSVGRLLRRLQP